MEFLNVNSLITDLYKNGQWKDILNFKKINNSSDSLRKLLWVWPDEKNLNFIAKHVRQSSLNQITSIGCGTGLFEWILQQCTGLKVNGIEIDASWWQSLYSPPRFIDMKFIDFNTIPEIESNNALLFCYYNDRKTFQQYLAKFGGNLLIIIGPKTGVDVHTDPTPFAPDFGSNCGWSLADYQQIENTIDYIAIYTK